MHRLFQTAAVLVGAGLLFPETGNANFASRRRHPLHDACSITNQPDGADCEACLGGPFSRPGCGDLVARGMTYRCTRNDTDGHAVYCWVPPRQRPSAEPARPAESKGWCSAAPQHPPAGCAAPSLLMLVASRSRARKARTKRGKS